MFDFPFSPNVDQIGREIYEKGGIVAAVCHGPIALANVKLSDGSYLVAGKRVAGFTDEEEAAISIQEGYPDHGGGKRTCKQVLTALGGIHQQTDSWQPHVEADSRLITGQNPASMMQTPNQ
jgi:putative intracellular protease/amidase